MIERNIDEVRKRIEEAAQKSGRAIGGVTLVAVTKTVAPEVIRQAIMYGVTDVGENRVQELLGKLDCFGGANIHLIGHLQKNKIKYIIGKTCLIHSVDSFSLAKEIDACAGKAGRVQSVLLEVNVSGEETKFGIPPSELLEVAKQAGELSNVRVEGLMTMAPYYEDKELTRDVFKRLRELSITVSEAANLTLNKLSMGMSNDYEVAVEEGATIVRIGTGIFKQ